MVMSMKSSLKTFLNHYHSRCKPKSLPSHREISHWLPTLVNQIPIDSFSKRQATVEAATYDSEFVASKTATKQILDLRHTLTYLGVLIKAK